MTLKLFVLNQNCYIPNYMVLGPMVPEVHDMRRVCLLKAGTPEMYYKYGFIHVSVRLCSFLRLV